MFCTFLTTIFTRFYQKMTRKTWDYSDRFTTANPIQFNVFRKRPLKSIKSRNYSDCQKRMPSFHREVGCGWCNVVTCRKRPLWTATRPVLFSWNLILFWENIQHVISYSIYWPYFLKKNSDLFILKENINDNNLQR